MIKDAIHPFWQGSMLTALILLFMYSGIKHLNMELVIVVLSCATIPLFAVIVVLLEELKDVLQ